MRVRNLIVWLSAGVARLAVAQGSPVTSGLTISGEVYDSVHARPIANATIMMTGTTDVATSDRLGRFVFRSVTPGPHTFTAYHAVIDSAGYAALSSRVDIIDERGVVHLALPSFRTLWSHICSGRFAADSGLVTGVVRDAVSRNPVAGAQVELAWMQPRIDSTGHVRQTRWTLTTTSNATGAYALCGIPMDAAPNIQATRPPAHSGIIDILGTQEHVLRRDLYVAHPDSTVVGTIVGTVSNTDGSPVAEARVVVDGVPEVRSARTGRFTLRNVPTGTRQLEVLALGVAPTAMPVDVFRGDTAVVNVTLHRVTTLDVVRVIGSASQRRLMTAIEDRRKTGWGRYIDSTQLAGVGNLTSAISAVPSVYVTVNRGRALITLQSNGHRCLGNLFVDGIRQNIGRQMTVDDYAILDDLRPSDIALIEVYVRGEDTPMEFASAWNTCGAIAVWTKSALQR